MLAHVLYSEYGIREPARNSSRPMTSLWSLQWTFCTNHWDTFKEKKETTVFRSSHDDSKQQAEEVIMKRWDFSPHITGGIIYIIHFSGSRITTKPVPPQCYNILTLKLRVSDPHKFQYGSEPGSNISVSGSGPMDPQYLCGSGLGSQSGFAVTIKVNFKFFHLKLF